MRRRSAVIAALAGALAVSVPGAAAVAAPAETSYTVVPYTDVNVRRLPTKNSAYPATLTAGRSYQAYCWTHGQTRRRRPAGRNPRRRPAGGGDHAHAGTGAAMYSTLLESSAAVGQPAPTRTGARGSGRRWPE